MDHSTVAAFLAAGCALVPIPLGEKGPRGKGWQKRERAVTGPENAPKLAGMNAGLLHEWSRTCAVDIDDYDATDAWLTEHGINLEALFLAENAVSVASGRPNRGKLIYRLPEGTRPLPTTKIKDDVGRVILELRCAGSQDVIAGKHPDTGTDYTVTGEPAAMPILPDPLLGIWHSRLNGAGTHDEPTPDAIPKGARNDTLFRIGCRARRAGLPEEAIHAALLAINKTCNPPLPAHEVGAIARSVVHGHHGPPESESVSDAEIDASELLATTFQPMRAIVPDLIVEGVNIAASKPKLGKTWLMLALALAGATGAEFMRRRIERVQCLFVALEDNDRRLQSRLRKLGAVLGTPSPGALRIRHEWPRGPEGATKLDDYLHQNAAVRLVIFDTYRGLAPKRARGGDLVAEDYATIRAYEQVADRRHVALVIVMHVRKSIDEADWIDAISGTHGLTAAADALLVLKRARGENTATLSVTGRDIEHEAELGLRFDREHGLWLLLGSAAEVQSSEERREVLHALRVSGTAMTQK
ncbi:MAG TPA: AAA family ATPase, partial [Casimicrobiaceae bacterium]